jgi:Fe-S cluster biosynthesis and repair protein YggX
MSSLHDRIAQFRKMATEDPENDLGHFRLGQLLLEDNQHAAASESFRRVLELNPYFSKVYQLLAASLLKLGRRDDAVRALTEGYRIADQRGDRMPRDEMGKMLTELGEKPPAQDRSAGGVAGTGFRCERPGCLYMPNARQLPEPPLPDAIGRRIHEKVCADCWNDWFRNMSIKVINELRLDLSTEFGQDEYDRHMREFFGFDEPSHA